MHRVSSMLAAGWGATSTVMGSVSMEYAALAAPPVLFSASRPCDSDTCFSLDIADEAEVPALLGEQADDRQAASLKAIVESVFEHLSHGGNVQGLPSHCDALDLHADACLALDQAVDLGISIGDAWLMLAYWANERFADTAVTKAFRPHLDGIDGGVLDQCMELFDRILGGYESDSWTLSRTRRLRQALSRDSM